MYVHKVSLGLSVALTVALLARQAAATTYQYTAVSGASFVPVENSPTTYYIPYAQNYPQYPVNKSFGAGLASGVGGVVVDGSLGYGAGGDATFTAYGTAANSGADGYLSCVIDINGVGASAGVNASFPFPGETVDYESLFGNSIDLSVAPGTYFYSTECTLIGTGASLQGVTPQTLGFTPRAGTGFQPYDNYEVAMAYDYGMVSNLEGGSIQEEFWTSLGFINPGNTKFYVFGINNTNSGEPYFSCGIYAWDGTYLSPVLWQSAPGLRIPAIVITETRAS